MFLLLAAIVLGGCTQAAPSPTPLPPPTATPTPTPTPPPTPGASVNLENVILPAPDPERLAKLSRLLTLVPDNFTAVVFVEVEPMASSIQLQSEFDLQGLGLPAIVPTEATNLLDVVGVVRGPEREGSFAVLHGPIDVGSFLQLAGGFGFSVGAPEPELYREHRLWNIDIFGLTLAVGEADATTVVISSGSFSPGLSTLDLIKGSLDSFDGLTSTLLDAPVNQNLLNHLPSGFATTLLDQCGDLTQLAAVMDLPGCAGAAVSAKLLGSDGVVSYGLIAFEDAALAKAGLQLALERIEADGGLPFGKVEAGQEGDLVWTKVTIDPLQLAQALEAFTQPN